MGGLQCGTRWERIPPLSSKPDPAGDRAKGGGEVSVSGPQVCEHPETSLHKASKQPWPRAFKYLTRAIQAQGQQQSQVLPGKMQSAHHRPRASPLHCTQRLGISDLLSPLYSLIKNHKGEEIMFPGGLNPRRFSLEPHLDGSKLPYLCFRVIGSRPNSWFGRITHDAPGGSPPPPT